MRNAHALSEGRSFVTANFNDHLRNIGGRTAEDHSITSGNTDHELRGPPQGDFAAFVAVHPEREAPKKPGSGGTLSDDLEREISQRLLTSNWSINASPYDARRFP
jgi:hypothetical protein